jgi:predicted Rossmann fold nucleotide-binding protein DprA/Smf involved in DNA uptake
MVDRSDMVICCIERKEGGAYQTIRYAEKQGKHIVNVADDGCGDGSLLYP